MSVVNLHRMDPVSMRLVVMCARHGSLSGGAEHSCISVSGASHRLKTFEAAIRTEIFVRHRRGLTVTPRGKEVVAVCAAVLNLIHQLPPGAESTSRFGIGLESYVGG